jgi:hypothetical protein
METGRVTLPSSSAEPQSAGKSNRIQIHHTGADDLIGTPPKKIDGRIWRLSEERINSNRSVPTPISHWCPYVSI